MVINVNSRLGKLWGSIPESTGDVPFEMDENEVDWILDRLADWPEAVMFANRSTPLTTAERHRLKEECREIRERLLASRETLTVDAVYDELPVEILWGLYYESQSSEEEIHEQHGTIIDEVD